MTESAIPPQRGDEHALFERYGDRLRRVTSFAVNTSPEIIDDACAFAWVQLLAHQPDRETLFSWLRTVARREAVRLDGAARGIAPLDEEGAAPQLVARRGTTEEAEGLLEVQDRLQNLPRRQREIVFLHATGWQYDEIAERLGVTSTRVGQLMSRAGARMREMDIDELGVRSPRAERLQQIERDPPSYIVASIGRPPRADPKRGGEELRLEWKRLALVIEDYRSAHEVTHPVLPLGPDDGLPARARLARRISQFREQRGLSRGMHR